MFTGEASAALDLYASIFPEFRLDHIERYSVGESGAEGTVKRAQATFGAHAIAVIDSPAVHAFTFTPSTSLFVDCDTEEELDTAFARLADGGKIFMPVGDYGFSRRFGWCSDRFGVSWQLNLP